LLEAAVAQLCYAAAIVFGIPFHVPSLGRLVDAVRDTQREFGAIGADGADFLRAVALDDADRREMQLRRFRGQAVRGARETAYYGRLFEQLGLDPARLRHEDIQQIPVTPKDALRTDPDAFVRRTAQPCFGTTTTGTTGRATSVSFSGAEMRAYAALTAISLLARGHVCGADIVQISTSARATLGNTCFAGACAHIGALHYLTGLVAPEATLALLIERRRVPGKKPQASYLSTYPSYLGLLVECGQRLGYGPADFGLERISVGGEVVSAGLKARCRQLFGPIPIDEGYAMTETWPVSATLCEQEHLHFEPSQGLLEVQRLDGTGAAAAGEAGTLVVTPFAPYRESSVLLRYDTEDVVRPLAGSPRCSLRALPATSNVLGKRRLSVQHDAGWTFPRDVIEALEAVEGVPLPARCGFWAVPGGVAVEVLVRQDTPGARREIERRLEDRGVPVRALHLAEERGRLRCPLPLRGDLREASFGLPPASGGPTFQPDQLEWPAAVAAPGS
jgi:phenylacetate-coenzyme A ligase PaaK-like adenylate-forming protein